MLFFHHEKQIIRYVQCHDCDFDIFASRAKGHPGQNAGSALWRVDKSIKPSGET